MPIPKPLKQVGFIGLALMIYAMIAAGVPVPWINEYRPHLLAAEIPNSTRGQQLLVSAEIQQGTLVGAPWDGSTSLGGMLGPIFASVGFSSPPDMTLCVVTDDGVRPKCYLKPRGTLQTSYCVDAFACDWLIPEPQGRAAGLVFFDVDQDLFGGGWDFIDAVYLLDGAGAEEFEKIDRLTRLLIEYVSPVQLHFPISGPDTPTSSWVYDRAEQWRREKMFAYFDLPELEAGQPLVQSFVTISTVR